MNISIEPLHPKDWEAIRSIYREGIATRNATFETDAPTWEVWDQGHLKACRLAARNEGRLVGWAALSPVSKRKVYAGVAEVSLYVAGSARAKGVGKALLLKLIEESEKAGIWTLQGGIFPENESSLSLHRACGFRIVGRRERIGKMDDVWRDVILMERRSSTAGI
ncbi:MAG: N-acetyltransferase [Desulfobacteraceae bacterium]|nr:MAG: N-acetyltransferase [Desulfobacteraceae bacterium]